MPKYDFDLITIGAGSGGVRASRMSAGFGARVAVVEHSRVGGTCVMRGCVPKKLLVYGAHFSEHFEDALGFGWSVGKTQHDWSALVAAKDKELNRLEKVYQRMLHDSGVALVEGHGVMSDPHTIEVDGKFYTAEKVLLSVGGWPFIPDIQGAEHVITSNEALNLKELPQKIVIVGGGYIALEFAGIFNALGSKVDVIIRSSNVLRGFDEDIRSCLAKELEKKGIRIHRECIVRSIESVDGGYSVYADRGREIITDKVMYATGRFPNTQSIGLLEAGIDMDRIGAVVVDEWNRSSVANVFAVGDVTNRINLTPVAINEGRVFAESFFNKNPITLDYSNIASAVFTQPPISTVGLTEEQARECHQVSVYFSRFKNMKHTLSGRDEHTTMKLIVDTETNKVLGCHMVGEDSPEIIQGLAIALKCGATKAQFDATVGIHPTAAEEFVTMRDAEPGSDQV